MFLFLHFLIIFLFLFCLILLFRQAAASAAALLRSAGTAHFRLGLICPAGISLSSFRGSLIGQTADPDGAVGLLGQTNADQKLAADQTYDALVQKAIEENKKLSIKYHDRNGNITERTIEPHVIVYKQGLWYVFAYCHLRNDFRFFKTGRIEMATILNDTFNRREIDGANLPMNFWHGSTETCDVIFEIDKKYLSDIEEWLGIENVSKVKDKFIAEAKLPYGNGLISKIISYGNGIKVIAPQELKDSVIKCANSILKIYK